MKNLLKPFTYLLLMAFAMTTTFAHTPAKLISAQTPSTDEISSKKQKQDEKTAQEEEQNDTSDEHIILENSDEDSQLIDDTQIENQNHTAKKTESEDLYNPAMDYGKGAPRPSPPPLSLTKRNVVACVASVVIAAIGIIATSHNEGQYPAPGTPRCP